MQRMKFSELFVTSQDNVEGLHQSLGITSKRAAELVGYLKEEVADKLDWKTTNVLLAVEAKHELTEQEMLLLVAVIAGEKTKLTTENSIKEATTQEIYNKLTEKFRNFIEQDL